MKISLFLPVLLLIVPFNTEAQEHKGKLKVFVDCSNTWCDQTFIRSEINMVDFFLDRVAADVHVLITSQDTGSGGDQYQLIFFGQHQFREQKDTLRFSTDPNSTEFEVRDQLLLYLKLGLAPFIAKTNQAKNISISLKSEEIESQDEEITKDKWNYWVYRVGANGSIDASQVYKSLNLRGNLSARRITDKFKIKFGLRGGFSNNIYEYDDDNGNPLKEVVRNQNYEFENTTVWSIDEHWSYGYELNIDNSTFSNYQARIIALPQIEYSIFPYKEVNNKFFTVRYGLAAQYNNYYDTTIYRKTDEYLFGQKVAVTLGLNQKWGTINTQLTWRNYFFDWRVNNLGLSTGIDVRITGGLSFNVYLYGALVRDQLNIKGQGVSESDVLTRRRLIASSFEFFSFFGINYRFGSKLNNFVNPRFEGPNW